MATSGFPEAQALCRRVDFRAHSLWQGGAATAPLRDMGPQQAYGAGGGWAPTPPLASQLDMDGRHTVLEADRSLQWGEGEETLPPRDTTVLGEAGQQPLPWLGLIILTVLGEAGLLPLPWLLAIHCLMMGSRSSK